VLWFEVNEIVLGTSAALLTIGVALCWQALPGGAMTRLRQGLISLSVLAAVLLQPVAAETLHEERSLYRDITVTQEGQRRCLVFNVHRGDRNQTCMNTADPERLVFEYAKMSFAGLLLNPNPRRVLIAGLGGGSLPSALTTLFPEAQIDVIEIDQAVVNVAKEFFDFEETDQVSVIVNDARVYVKRAALLEKKYDLVILDAFTGDYIPEHLLTLEFLQEGALDYDARRRACSQHILYQPFLRPRVRDLSARLWRIL
jgi:spermidine synthase